MEARSCFWRRRPQNCRNLICEADSDTSSLFSPTLVYKWHELFGLCTVELAFNASDFGQLDRLSETSHEMFAVPYSEGIRDAYTGDAGNKRNAVH